VPKIKFKTHPHIVDAIPHPKPAIKFTPNWYKDLNKEYQCPMSEVSKIPTLKQCLPVRDFITSGYIIPAWCDMLFKKDSKGKIRTDNMKLPEDFNGLYNMGFSSHNVKQVKGTPLEAFCDGDEMVKLNNPWMIETPSGYSCFLMSPFYETSDITTLPAVVDTDSHITQTNFPCIISSDEAFIKKGDPLVQVIPFKRDSWTSEIGTTDLQKVASATARFFTEIKSVYTTKLWKRKYYR
jgi:hypothetical protein